MARDIHVVHNDMPVLALRGLVVFPGMSLQFEVGRRRSIAALRAAMENDQLILLVAQKDLTEAEPKAEDLFETGVVASIKQVLKAGDEAVRVYVEGGARASIVKMMKEDPYLCAMVEEYEQVEGPQSYRAEAYLRRIQNQFEEYVRLYHPMSPDVIMRVISEKDCGRLADFVAANIQLDYAVKQEILDEHDPLARIRLLSEILDEELKVLAIEAEINEKTQKSVDENQRDYYLREQMKTIADELGEDDNPLQESEEFRKKVTDLHLLELQEKKLLRECDRLAKMPFGSQEGSVIRGYLETCLDLPWNTISKESVDLKKARRVLDRDHYGLTKVKDRIIEALAVHKLAPQSNGQILCLVGPPGVGKTSIAHSIAEALGRKYVRVSLGGVHDESEIMGHRRTYVGSMPGRIMAAVKQAGTRNPLILLDEIDKLSKDFRGDPASALLEVLDTEQNNAFQDHFIDMPFDLSQVMFLTTANDASTIPGPLYDRMDVIELPSYTSEEKYQIAVRHLIPKQLAKNGLTKKQLRITPAGVRDLVENYTRDAGVRTLERRIADLCRKAAKNVVENPGEDICLTVSPKNMEELLGPRRYKRDENAKKDEIGLVNGLAWTSVGGEMLPIEVAVMEGTGKMELTGSLGDVMKESIRTAISCIRTHAKDWDVPADFYTKKDIHVHCPEGAVPKDGPSAGIAMVTAITSALTGIPVRHDVAMTGEVTLRGRVLPIGGLREKSMAAYRSGIRTVLFPADNAPDLSEVDAVVREAVTFVPVSDDCEVLPKALTEKPGAKKEHSVVHTKTSTPAPAVAGNRPTAPCTVKSGV